MIWKRTRANLSFAGNSLIKFWLNSAFRLGRKIFCKGQIWGHSSILVLILHGNIGFPLSLWGYDMEAFFTRPKSNSLFKTRVIRPENPSQEILVSKIRIQIINLLTQLEIDIASLTARNSEEREEWSYRRVVWSKTPSDLNEFLLNKGLFIHFDSLA